MKSVRVKNLSNVIHALQRRMEEVVKEDFPIGSTVVYEHGDQERLAEVVGHGSRSDIFIIGSMGTKYRLDSWRIEEVF